MASKILVTLTIPLILAAALVLNPAGSEIRDEAVSLLSFDGTSGVTDCSAIPISELTGVVFMDNVLSTRERGGTFHPSGDYVRESMRHIKMQDMNVVRVPIFWEAYANNSAAFLDELQVVASAAADYDICVIFDNHHWYTSSAWGIAIIGEAQGRGFPSYVAKDFPVIESEDKYLSTAAPFWGAFLKNEITIEGRQIWDVQMEFMAQVIDRTDRFDNVLGYEILNEPHLFNASQYDDLGNYHTYMAKGMRELTAKKIFFDRETAWGFQRTASLEHKIVPRNVTGLVYTPHLYSVPNPGSQGEAQLTNFKNWSSEWGTEVLVGEWSARTQEDNDMYLKAFKDNGFGWTYFSWRPTESQGRGVSLYDALWTPSTEGLRQLSVSLDRVYSETNEGPDGLGPSSKRGPR